MREVSGASSALTQPHVDRRNTSLSLEDVLTPLAGRPDLASVLGEFKPPPRFATSLFDDYRPRHPTQAAAEARLRELAASLSRVSRPMGWRGLAAGRKSTPKPSGIYLDGGFGVGKTHLLAALWHATAGPRAFLSFDELMYLIGMVGLQPTIAAFRTHRLIAIDEWELDDPGNLKLALAFLRGILKHGSFIAVTSNTLPLDLGAGRFSQKDFRAELEELSSAFEVIRIEGTDFRQRRFEAEPGRHHFIGGEEMKGFLARDRQRVLVAGFREFVSGLARTHPTRYRELARSVGGILIEDVTRLTSLPDTLRWVHCIDAIYDAGVPFAATSRVPMVDIFFEDALMGPYGKKLSRCLSRMEEMLGEGYDGPVADRDGSRMDAQS